MSFICNVCYNIAKNNGYGALKAAKNGIECFERITPNGTRVLTSFKNKEPLKKIILSPKRQTSLGNWNKDGLNYYKEEQRYTVSDFTKGIKTTVSNLLAVKTKDKLLKNNQPYIYLLGIRKQTDLVGSNTIFKGFIDCHRHFWDKTLWQKIENNYVFGINVTKTSDISLIKT